MLIVTGNVMHIKSIGTTHSHYSKCVCMSVRMCVHVFMCMHTRVQACMALDACACLCVYTHVSALAYSHVIVAVLKPTDAVHINYT